MSPITPAGETRARLYRYVRERIEEGNPPTVREVQEAMGFRAVETARKHLERLVRDGQLVKSAGRSRGYSLPAGMVRPTVQVPLLGRVPAGDLAEAVQHASGSIPVEVRSSSHSRSRSQRSDGKAARDDPPELFALTIEGESMIDAGIMPGDIVIVRAQPTARSGQIVVAMVGDEATVKTLRRSSRRIELHPENKRYQVIVPKASEVRILGIVVEVRRYLERS